MRMWKRKGVRIIASLVVTCPLIWLSLRKIDWPVLGASFARVRWFWVVLAVINVVFSVYALGWRWRILLRPKARVAMRRLFRLNMIGQYTNIISPARVGEVVRGYLAGKIDNLPVGYAMGTVVFEKILDFFLFLTLWIVFPAAFFLGNTIQAYDTALAASCVVLIFLTLLVLKPDLFLHLLHKLSFLFPEKYRRKIQEFFRTGVEFFQLLKDWRTALVLVALTAALLAGQALTNYFLFQAFGLKLSFLAAIVVLVIVQAGNIPPSLPGRIGIFEYAVILALALFGIDKERALSYGIMLHLVAYLPKIVFGQYLIIKYKMGRDMPVQTENLEPGADDYSGGCSSGG